MQLIAEILASSLADTMGIRGRLGVNIDNQQGIH